MASFKNFLKLERGMFGVTIICIFITSLFIPSQVDDTTRMIRNSQVNLKAARIVEEAEQQGLDLLTEEGVDFVLERTTGSLEDATIEAKEEALNIYVTILELKKAEGERELGEIVKALVYFEKRIGFVRDILGEVEERSVGNYGVQYNPARSRRTAGPPGAKTTSGCFLCSENRSSLQKEIKWNNYDILSNFSPILENHLVLASDHSPQVFPKIRVNDSLDFIEEIGSEFVVFYNGPDAGASIPDHYHLQGFTRHLPIEEMNTEEIVDNGVVKVSKLIGYPTGNFVVETNDKESASEVINDILRLLDEKKFDYNVIFTINSEGMLKTYIIPRNPDAKIEVDGKEILGVEIEVMTPDGPISTKFKRPASVEMGGIFIIGEEAQKPIYDYITEADIAKALRTVGIGEEELGYIYEYLLRP